MHSTFYAIAMACIEYIYNDNYKRQVQFNDDYDDNNDNNDSWILAIGAPFHESKKWTSSR